LLGNGDGEEGFRQLANGSTRVVKAQAPCQTNILNRHEGGGGGTRRGTLREQRDGKLRVGGGPKRVSETSRT